MNEKRKLIGKGCLKSRVLSILLAMAVVMTGITWPSVSVQAADYTYSWNVCLGETDSEVVPEKSAALKSTSYDTAGIATVSSGYLIPTGISVNYTGNAVGKTKATITLYKVKDSTYSKTITADISVVAKVTLDAAGGSGVASYVLTDTSGKVTLPAPTKEDFTFVGWSGNGIIYQAGTNTIKQNITLTAQWKSNHEHAWSYQTDSTDSSKINAYCTGEGDCDYKTVTTASPAYTIAETKDSVYNGNVYDMSSNITVTNTITDTTGAQAPNYVFYTDAGLTTKTQPYTRDDAGNITAGQGAETEGGAPKKVGTYYVAATIGGATAVKQFEIKKADRNCQLSMSNYTYEQTAALPVPTITDTEENPEVHYYYSTSEDGTNPVEWDSSKLTTASIAAGTYYMYATVGKTTDYNAVEKTASVAFTIQPADGAEHVTATAYSGTYDGKAHGITLNVDAESLNTTIYYYTYTSDGTKTEKTTTAPTFTAAGLYTVGYEVNIANHILVEGSRQVSITKAEATVSFDVTSSKTYDGTTTAEIKNYTVTGLVIGEKVTIQGLKASYTDSADVGENKPVSVVTAGAEFSTDGTNFTDELQNYNITYQNTDFTAAIKPRTAKISWPADDIIYNGKVQGITATVTNLVDTDSLNISYETSGTTCNFATEVGTYTAKIASLGNENYALPTDSSVSKTWEIKYLALAGDPVSGMLGENGYYTSDVTLGNSDYKVRLDGENEWKESVTYTNPGSHTIRYSVMNSSGYITDVRELTIKIDTDKPTGTIKVKDNEFISFLNTITFGYFFKNMVDVTIEGTDAISGIGRIEYQKVAKNETYSVDGTWTEYNGSFSVSANDKSVVYAKITDKAGNFVIINTEGIVVYTDATESAEAEFARTSTQDVTTGIRLYGNTIASVSIKPENGIEENLDASAYESNQDRFVLKASYLGTLTEGTYTLSVKYNPYGEIYTAGQSVGEAPKASAITLTVKKVKGSIDNITDISKTYNGIAVDAPDFSTTNNTTVAADENPVTIEYKEKGAEDATYTIMPPKVCGDYVVRISVAADENYEAVSATAEFLISHDWSVDWSVERAATTDREGKRTKVCPGCGTIWSASIAKLGKTESEREQNLEKASEVDQGSSITDVEIVTDKDEILDNSGLYTDDEVSKLVSGDVTSRIYLEIKESENLDQNSWMLIKNAAENKSDRELTGILCFEMNLFTEITFHATNTTETKKYTQLEEPMELSLRIPEKLIQKDTSIVRTYQVIRLHDGKAEALDTTHDVEKQLLYFKTDKFSTYAIAYMDIQLVTGVSLAPTGKTLTARGETVTLSATVAPANAANKNVTWESSDSSVATVDSNGLVTAVANGTATITVTTEDGFKTATAEITVNIPAKDDSNNKDTDEGGGSDNNNNSSSDNNSGKGSSSGNNNSADTINGGKTNNKGNAAKSNDVNKDKATDTKDDSAIGDTNSSSENSDKDKSSENSTDDSDKADTAETVNSSIKDKSEVVENVRKRLESALEAIKKLDSEIQEGAYVVPDMSDKKSDGASNADGTNTVLKVNIPTDLQKDGRVFYLMSVDADGNVIVLPGELAEDGILTVIGSFDADTSYQIIYEDIADSESGMSMLSSYLTEDGHLLDADGNAVTIDTASQNNGANQILIMSIIVVVIVIIIGFCIFLVWKRRKHEDEEN